MVGTALHWLPVANFILLVGYGLVTLVKRRGEESVRQFTRATATGFGIAILIVIALVAFTLFI